MKKRVIVNIYGQVQGVFFRDSARKKAVELGLAGFVRNEPNGTVYIEAEGGNEALKKFLSWCCQGSSSARVEKVQSKRYGELKNFNDFKVV